MKCNKCGKSHESTHPHFKLVKELNDKGFPTHSPKYASAHEKANKVEKKAYPKGYKEMQKVDRKLSKHELAGKNERSGKIEVSKKVPKHLREEVALHEKVENKAIRKKK